MLPVNYKGRRRGGSGSSQANLGQLLDFASNPVASPGHGSKTSDFSMHPPGYLVGTCIQEWPDYEASLGSCLRWQNGEGCPPPPMLWSLTFCSGVSSSLSLPLYPSLPFQIQGEGGGWGNTRSDGWSIPPTPMLRGSILAYCLTS